MTTPFSDPVHGVSMSVALREAATYAPVDRTVLLTYEFVHPTFTSRALIVADHENLTAFTENGDEVEFIAVAGLRSEGFPESDEEATPLIRLAIDGVSNMVIDKLDMALSGLEPVEVIERVYVSDDLTTPALLPPARAIVRTGTVTETRVTVEVGFGDPANQPYPRKVYTRKEYPGLSA
jgi:hypothetical protein